MSERRVHFLEKLLLLFESRAEYFVIFSKFRMRSEGWVKGEILKMLDDMSKNGEIEGYETERSFWEWVRTKM